MSEMSVYKFVIPAALLLVVIAGGDEHECNLSRTDNDLKESPGRCSASALTPVTEFACPMIVRPGVLISTNLVLWLLP